MSKHPRLNAAALAGLADRAALPGYDRDKLGIGQLHLGLGAFHRAHQAVFTEAVLNTRGGDWGICGVSLRSPAVRDSLAPQDLLYSVTERENTEQRHSIIGCLRECLVAPEKPVAVINRIADPGIAVVTLTITEKGYCLDTAGERLDRTHPDIAADTLAAPKSAIGYLVAGLEARRLSGAGGLTLLSCDNLAGNGHKLDIAVRELAEQLAPALPDWLERQCRFPCSMVDRIVPATSEADRQSVAAALGVEDAAAVVTEPFSQWVIEADFAGPVPSWDRVGADFVEDVAPFEAMKLRLLNASHSSIAYLGCLAGLETVADVLEAPGVRELLQTLMADEMEPTLDGLGAFDLAAYRDALLQRFANRGLGHRCAQIAMDGSQKIPQRLLPPLRAQLEQGGPIDATAFTLACWLRYLGGVDDSGNSYSIEDPRAAELTALAAAHRAEPARYVESVLSLFDGELAASMSLRERILQWFTRLDSRGAAAGVAAFATPGT